MKTRCPQHSQIDGRQCIKEDGHLTAHQWEKGEITITLPYHICCRIVASGTLNSFPKYTRDRIYHFAKNGGPS